MSDSDASFDPDENDTELDEDGEQKASGEEEDEVGGE